MSIYLAKHHVSAWSDARTFQEAQALQQQAAVQDIQMEGDRVRATVHCGGRWVRTRFRVLEDGSVLSDCPCPQGQLTGTVCLHVVAAGLVVAARTEDTRRERQQRIKKRREHESRRPPASPLSGRRETAPNTPPDASVFLRLPAQWEQDLEDGTLHITCRIVVGGKRLHPARIKPGRPLPFSPQNLELLYILEDLAGCRSCPPEILIPDITAFGDLLYACIGRDIAVLDAPEPLHVSDVPALSALQLVPAPQQDRTFLLRHISLPEGKIYTCSPHATWLRHQHTFHLLEPVLPMAWQKAYHGPVSIPPQKILSFLRHTLPALEEQFPLENETNLSPTPQILPGTPEWLILIQGDMNHISIRLTAQYDGIGFPVTHQPPSPDQAVPTRTNPAVFLARNPLAEQAALESFEDVFGPVLPDAGSINITGQQVILTCMTETVPSLSQQDWTIVDNSPFADICKKGHWIEAHILILPYEQSLFRIELAYRDDTGQSVPTELVENALRDGKTILTHGSKLLLLDAHAIRSLQASLAECTQYRNATAYIELIHAGFIQALAQQSHRVSLEAPPRWMQHVEKLCAYRGLPDIYLTPHLQHLLRGYQKHGIQWLSFLDQCGYAGVLADEMGLGKTVQALAWLEHRKQASPSTAPSIVVCPTSLLHNWAREIKRFTPHLSHCVVAGPQRHTLWHKIPSYDIIITSYALLRRDTDHYAQLSFSAAILDEAQHIKNRSTQNALAAKRLKAERRLVLTGTPIENSVSDLWSIMDFLMPGYLGSHNSFRIRFEQPVQAGNMQSQKALGLLRAKLSPFMLRRLKSEVAAEMPSKVTRVATVEMVGAQRKLYQRLLHQYYERISSLVDENGFEKARFSVFSALLRLRQCCCHPALLRHLPDTANMNSAKLELFFELLHEAMDGGHRVLVFSQFVQMLHILREALRKRDIRFAYLDGSTRNRMEQVDAFNNNPDVPVFLVSLKAGGSGLNLTGANVVIHYDPWWNPAVEEQATDRTHRIGQTQTVYSIKLVTEDSIEEKVIHLQHRKRRIINAAMGATGGFAQQITWQDIQELLQP